MVIIEKHVGLDIIYKLFAICRDNASSNNTFYNHLYQRLLSNRFDNNPTSGNSLLICRFYRRQSRIRYIAYIIVLVVSTVLKSLYTRIYVDVATLLQAVKENKGVFPPECNALSVYQKIRAFVLYIIVSEECRVS